MRSYLETIAKKNVLLTLTLPNYACLSEVKIIMRFIMPGSCSHLTEDHFSNKEIVQDEMKCKPKDKT